MNMCKFQMNRVKKKTYSSYKAKCDFVLQELSLLVPVVTLSLKIYMLFGDNVFSPD